MRLLKTIKVSPLERNLLLQGITSLRLMRSSEAKAVKLVGTEGHLKVVRVLTTLSFDRYKGY